MSSERYVAPSGRGRGRNYGGYHHSESSHADGSHRSESSRSDGYHHSESSRSGGRGRRDYSDWPPRPRRGRGGRTYTLVRDDEPEDLHRTISSPTTTTSQNKFETSTRMEDVAALLKQNAYECIICCLPIKRTHSIFTCQPCSRIFHLNCIQKWAKSAAFRCPNCQGEHKTPPSAYLCFCSKTRNPEFDNYSTPHCCQQLCGRKRGQHCIHPCSLQCHPGLCPPCVQNREIHCHCGKETMTVPCSDPRGAFECGGVCLKLLNCGKHTCEHRCHSGPCLSACKETVTVACFCKACQKQYPCGTEPPSYCCGTTCSKPLSCGHHECERNCHEGDCGPCPYSPELTKTCPCGKKSLHLLKMAPRKSCTDPIPECGQVCGKKLRCGVHTCTMNCHVGGCDECKTMITVHCRCGQSHQRMPCYVFSTLREEYERQGTTEPINLQCGNAEYTYPIVCTRTCNATLSCGKHKCERLCCEARTNAAAAPTAHVCRRICGRKLPCGSHTCEDLCHKGNCLSCPYIITDELPCACGKTVMQPPLPCSTKPPACRHPCIKERECGHPSVDHPCHFGDCPPCTVPVNRPCSGGHMDLMNVPCHLKTKSCGQSCGKLRECGHPCRKTCHAGPCDAGANGCGQNCGKPLPCNHPCLAKCHPDKPCPPCSAKVEITCDCGRRKENLTCRQYDHLLKSKTTNKKGVLSLQDLPKLECSRECEGEMRLNRLAQALGIKDEPKERDNCYWPAFMVVQARGSLHELLTYEAALKELMSSSAKTLHIFTSVHRDKRAFLHNLVSHYQLRSESFDKDPKRDVHVTKTPNSKTPVPLLSQAAKDVNYETTSVAKDRMEKTPNACILFEGLPPHCREPELMMYLGRFSGSFAFLWLNDSLCAACFPTAQMASEAMSGAIKGGCPYTIRSYHATLYPQLHANLGSAAPKPRQKIAIRETKPAESNPEDFQKAVKTAKVKAVVEAPIHFTNTYSALAHDKEWPALR